MSTLVAEGFAAWRECREAFDELLHAQYQAAEEATHGALLNERGRQAGIDPWRLFTSNALFRGNGTAGKRPLDDRTHPRGVHRRRRSFGVLRPDQRGARAAPHRRSYL
jgi:hypothetical protein